MKSALLIPDKIRDEAWRIAGQVEWTKEDWTDFYEAVTCCFLKIAARHAKAKIEAFEAKESK